MSQKLADFYRRSFSDFIEASINLLMFLPYFFSIQNLLSTLFSPWKHLEAKKTSAGFSLSEWLSKLSFNAISRFIGFSMRLSIILFYFLLQAFFLLLLPFVGLIFFLLVPLFFLESLFKKTEEEKKETRRLKFIGQHLLNQENYAQVAEWFEDYYKQYIHKAKWWKKSNLFSLPPLARDWAVGYTPTLDQYGQDLTSSVYHIDTKHIVDRDKEIDEIERVLSKSQEASIVIVGEEGVGKHTIVVALAKKIYEGKTNSLLMYKRIIRLHMAKILTEFTDIKQRENFFEELLSEAAEAKNIIIFIDHLEKYIDFESRGIDLTTSIEKFAKSNRLQFVGITTPFFYQKFIQSNERLLRLLSKINVKEITQAEAEKILLRLVYMFETRYHVSIPYETINNTILKSDFYITEIPFPEKAIELLDSACVLAKKNVEAAHNRSLPMVTPELIDKILFEKTHIPTTLTEEIKEKLIRLEQLLFQQIIQQEEAVKKVSAALRRSFLLIGKRKKPLASFLFLGPTGVGKTETAKALSRIFFGGESYLVRFDMSNYQMTTDIPQLIGSLNTGNPGLLAKAIRENPYGVLLLDEFEKANKDLVNIFLTVLDEGYFADGFGKRVDCKNLVIIATSNAPDQNVFLPEFLNRFDGIVIFKSLDKTSIYEIAKKMIEIIADDVYKLHKVKLTISDVFLNNMIKNGYDEKFGARNLDRLIRDEIEDKIAKMILEGKVREGETINL